MKKLLCVICLLWGIINAYAQENPLNHKFHLSYLGESILNPGFRIGYSHEFWKKNKIKTPTKKFPEGKSKVRSLAMLYQLGFYSRKKLYTSIPVTASILYTKTKPKGLITQFGVCVGYDRTFLKGTTYSVDDSGDVTENTFEGSGYLSSQYSIGMGIDFNRLSNPSPISLMFKNSIFIKHQYNDTHMPFWLTDIELTFTLNHKKS